MNNMTWKKFIIYSLFSINFIIGMLSMSIMLEKDMGIYISREYLIISTICYLYTSVKVGFKGELS